MWNGPLLFVYLAYVLSASSSAVTVRVHLPENSIVGTRVANCYDVMDLPETATGFKFLGELLFLTEQSRSGVKLRRKWMKLDKKSGIVILRRAIDREEMCGDALSCFLELKIFVTSQRKLLKLNVVIDDVNDSAPQFPTNQLTVNVSEAAQVGDVISLGEFAARDDDLGNNSLISYVISGNLYFDLEELRDDVDTRQLQLRLKRKLDFETEPLQKMTLTARDHGNPTLSTQAELVIRVTDVNDNSPVFLKKEYFVNLPENLHSGQVIERVQASDADPKDAGSLRYSVSRRNKKIGRDLIAVNPITGDVTLKEVLDRERHDNLRILVEARDSDAANQRVGRTWLRIKVDDVNDNAPNIDVQFILTSEDKTVFLLESSSIGTYLAYVTAEDPDSGDNGKTRVTIDSISAGTGSQVASKPFNLTEAGFLCLNASVDRELVNNYDVVLKACDHGNPSKCSTETIVVQLLDDNDHQPVFVESTVNLILSEDVRVGSIVATVRATDGDDVNQPALYRNDYNEIEASPYGEIFYHLIDGDGTFEVDPYTGDVVLSRFLDRELIDEYRITLRAKDGGRQNALQSTCKLHIRVTDVNDNQPSFTQPRHDNSTYYATILRDHVILRVQAVDYDSGENGTVVYQILSLDGISRLSDRDDVIFVIDPQSGELRLNFSNNRLNESLGRHRIVLQAADSGVISLQSTRTLDVIVTDLEQLPLVSDSNFSLTSARPIFIVIACTVAFVIIVIVMMLITWRCMRTPRKTLTPVIAKKDEILNEDKLRSDERDEDEEEGHQESDVASDRRFDSVVITGQKSPVSCTVESDKLNNKSLLSSNSLTKSLPSRHEYKNDVKQSQVDADSGRGDSDPDAPGSDVTTANGYQARIQSPLRNDCCTEQCLVLGHSDACWMPKLKQKSSLLQPPRGQVQRVTSPLYVELSPLPETVPCPNFNGRFTTQPSLTPTSYWNYPANELSSIYYDVIANRRPQTTNRGHVGRTTPKIGIIEDKIPHGSRSTSSASSLPHQRPSVPEEASQHSDKPIRNLNSRPWLSDSEQNPLPLSRSASADLLRNLPTSSPLEQGRTFPKQYSKKGHQPPLSMAETQVIVDSIDQLLDS